MSWYYGTYACGHEGRTNIIGSTKNRQWIADRHFEKLCPECWELKKIEDKEKANIEAAKKSKDMELPELEGTEKQVAWANTLRQIFIDKCEKRFKEFEKRYKDNALSINILNEGNEILQFVLVNKIKANWYIENRELDLELIFKNVKKELNAKTEEETPEGRAVVAESIIFPQNVITNVVAKLSIIDDTIYAKFEKSEKFREIVKSLDYKWGNENVAWIRKINETTGMAEDRLAELGNKLLNAGFPIQILDEDIRRKAINGDYAPECKRWIYLRTKGYYEGYLAINWTDGSELYDKVRKLPGSKWDKPSIVIKPERYNEIEEFAQLYGFQFTKKALKKIEEVKELIQSALIVKPNRVQEIETKDGLKEILKSGSDIIDDLKDNT